MSPKLDVHVKIQENFYKLYGYHNLYTYIMYSSHLESMLNAKVHNAVM